MLKPLYNFISKFSEEISELRDYDGEAVDKSAGRMNQKEVLERILPIAEEKGFIGKNENVVLYAEEPYLFHYARKDKLVWIINFLFKTPEMEATVNYTPNSFAVIKVDDATGEIIEARAIRE